MERLPASSLLALLGLLFLFNTALAPAAVDKGDDGKLQHRWMAGKEGRPLKRSGKTALGFASGVAASDASLSPHSRRSVFRRLRTKLEGGVETAEGGALRLRQALWALGRKTKTAGGSRGAEGGGGADRQKTDDGQQHHHNPNHHHHHHHKHHSHHSHHHNHHSHHHHHHHHNHHHSHHRTPHQHQQMHARRSPSPSMAKNAPSVDSRLGGGMPTGLLSEFQIQGSSPFSSEENEDRRASPVHAVLPSVPGSATGLPQNNNTRRLPLSSPFVRHYYKEVVVLWEWHTKTVGASMNGRRRQDEDALVVHSPCKGKSNARLKALFDGHGGFEISRACAAKLFDFFGSMPDFSEDSFVRAALSLDEELRTKSNKNDKSGSTGVVVAIERPKEEEPRFLLHVANVGDSRALLLRPNGTYSILTKDHKPNDPSELSRILKAGGFVTRARKTFRVNGSLALSRAFGDRDLKANASLPATEQKVVAVPDVRTFEAREGDYILIACDGMFEAMGMNWDFVANLLKLELQGTNDNLVETAFRLLNTAYLFGSSDNVSVVLTKLMPQKKIHPAIKRFCYDFTGKKLVLEERRGKTPNVEKGGTFDLEDGLYVTLF